MSTTTEKPRRKFPAPCWTQEEALALIEAYRERWYALRRGYLRTADWEAVAAEVSGRCPNVTPAKTSAQCRHKMEKLRQRYRTDKQRSIANPGRFFSSWIFFDNMDAMENGASSAVGSDQVTDNGVNSGSADQVKQLIDRNYVPLGFKSKKSKKIDPNSNPSMNRSGRNLANVNSNPNLDSRVLNGHSSYLDGGSDQEADEEVGFGSEFKNPIHGNFVPPGLRGSKFGNSHGNSKSKLDSDHDVDDGDRFRVKIAIDQNSVPTGPRARKFSKFDGVWNFNSNGDINSNGGFNVKSPNDRNSVPPGFRAKNTGKAEGSSNPNSDPRVLNGFSSSRFGFGKMSDGRGVKRERGSVAEMVSSIKLLGEGFLKMEKMKMEMAREIEQMRMEMEMKRNELVLESQKQIVDAFVKALTEKKQQKIKTVVAPES